MTCIKHIPAGRRELAYRNSLQVSILAKKWNLPPAPTQIEDGSSLLVEEAVFVNLARTAPILLSWGLQSSDEKKAALTFLLAEYRDVFAWSYAAGPDSSLVE